MHFDKGQWRASPGEVAHTGSLRHAIYAMCAARQYAEARGEPIAWLQNTAGTWGEYWQRNWAQLAPLLAAQPWCHYAGVCAVHGGPFAGVPLWGWAGSLPSWYQNRVSPGNEMPLNRAWLAVPMMAPEAVVYVSWRLLSGGRRHAEFPWCRVIGELCENGVVVRWLGTRERYAMWQQMTGIALDVEVPRNLYEAAMSLARGYGFLGSPGVYAALSAGAGQRRVLVTHEASCEHWGTTTSRLAGNGAGVVPWLLHGADDCYCPAHHSSLIIQQASCGNEARLHLDPLAEASCRPARAANGATEAVAHCGGN
jgi:hypothetical protein